MSQEQKTRAEYRADRSAMRALRAMGPPWSISRYVIPPYSPGPTFHSHRSYGRDNGGKPKMAETTETDATDNGNVTDAGFPSGVVRPSGRVFSYREHGQEITVRAASEALATVRDIADGIADDMASLVDGIGPDVPDEVREKAEELIDQGHASDEKRALKAAGDLLGWKPAPADGPSMAREQAQRLYASIQGLVPLLEASAKVANGLSDGDSFRPSSDEVKDATAGFWTIALGDGAVAEPDDDDA